MAWVDRVVAPMGRLGTGICGPAAAVTPRACGRTFSVGSAARNLARADGFKRMVEAAGQCWPHGWVKGERFVRPPFVLDP